MTPEPGFGVNEWNPKDEPYINIAIAALAD